MPATHNVSMNDDDELERYLDIATDEALRLAGSWMQWNVPTAALGGFRAEPLAATTGERDIKRPLHPSG